MAKDFTFEDLMALRKKGITIPFEKNSSYLEPDKDSWTPDISNSYEDEYLQAKNANLLNEQPPQTTPEFRKEIEQNSIFRNLSTPSIPTKEQELSNLIGKGAQIGTEAGLQFGKTQQSEEPRRTLASIINPSQDKKETSLSELLNFGKNDLASQEKLKQAIDERNSRQLIANLASAASTVGGGLAQTGPIDNSAFDRLSKQAEQSVTDYEKQVEFQKNDPNSAYSQGLRDYFKTKLGIEVRGDASAVDLEKLMPFAVREFEAKEERALRKEQRELDRIQRAEDRAEDRKLRQALAETTSDKKLEAGEQKAKDKLTTNTRLIRKEIMSGPSGKAYNNYLNADRASKSIEQFMKNPSGYSDYATLMGGLKALQGDDSVVREAEIRLGMNAASLQDKVLNQIERLRSGKALQKGQRENILNSVKTLADITKGQFLQAASPQLAQAEELGIPREQLIDSVLEKPQNNDKTKEKIKAFMKSNPSVKTEEEAIQILKDAGRL